MDSIHAGVTHSHLHIYRWCCVVSNGPAVWCGPLAVNTHPGAVSAADLLAREAAPAPAVGNNSNSNGRGRGRISTSCAALDALLGGGGVACGTVTEFCEFAAHGAAVSCLVQLAQQLYKANTASIWCYADAGCAAV